VDEGVFGRLLATTDSFTAAPDRFVDGGDDVTVLGHYSGTMKHSGATLDAPFCQVFRFEGDQIVSFLQCTDSVQWAQLMP
jgi:ketosteroid isomerase-like protein